MWPRLYSKPGGIVEPITEQEAEFLALGNAEDLDQRLVEFLMKLPFRFGLPAPIVDQEMAKLGPVPNDYREVVIMTAAILLATDKADGALFALQEYLYESVTKTQFMTRFIAVSLAMETVLAAVGDSPERSQALHEKLARVVVPMVGHLPPGEQPERFQEPKPSPVELKKFQIALVRDGLKAVGA